MKKLGMVALLAMVMVACNNSTNATQSTEKKTLLLYDKVADKGKE